MSYSVDRNTGIFGSEAEALEASVKRLAEVIKPHAIFLFGSRARGNHRPDSDFDFLILTREEDGEGGRDYARMRRALKGFGLDTDIVPVRFDDFTAEMESETSMVSAAMQGALRIYDEKEGYRFPPVEPGGT
jgi:predicted nucleotidyltransferase